MNIHLGNSLLVLVDVQEKLVSAMSDFPSTLAKINLLLQSAVKLELPVIVTEQYPKGLGPTLSQLKTILPDNIPVIEKTDFSCCGATDFTATLPNYPDLKNIILVGIESHVCVLQTALDLANLNYQVLIASDAVTSRQQNDKTTALNFLAQQNNIAVLPAESLLFLLLKTAKHPRFREISPLLK